MRSFTSPTFTHDKLDLPLYKDMVDVFEDRILYWLLSPAKKLLSVRHGSVAAVALATSYIEAIEMYISGTDSKGKSEAFFRRGYKRIFAPVSGPAYMQDAIASALYQRLRCGFMHDAMFRAGIYFSGARKEAITITWPKKNGKFNPEGQLESAIINPRRFVDCIDVHFTEYMKELRARKPNEAQEKFRSAVAVKWSLGGPDRLVGMTEEQFASGV